MDGAQRSSHGPKRAYQACVRCRQRKARCLISNEAPAASPLTCQRCMRERRECIFTSERNNSNADRSNQLTTADVNQEPCSQSSPAHSTPATEADVQVPPIEGNLPDRVTRADLSTQTDALNLLFEAAEQYHAANQPAVNAGQPGDVNDDATSGNHTNYSHPQPHMGSSNSSTWPQNWLHPGTDLHHNARDHTMNIFSRLPFVKKRWLTAEEAATYIQLFFENMNPLSPILTPWYSDPQNFHALVLHEPVLCTVILTLSSRYHMLQGDGWVCRSFSLHNQLSKYCHSLLHHVIWGQEEETVGSTRSIGTVEGLLLMAEWHTRSLHLPHGIEAWDSDDSRAERNVGEETVAAAAAAAANKSSRVPKRWLEGVVQPLRRSDRMSWSLIQTAVGLAHELGVFDETSRNMPTSTNATDPLTNPKPHRKRRLQVLLYLYINQLAFRIGYSSLVPSYLATLPPNSLDLVSSVEISDQWLNLMPLWAELTAITRTSHELIFASRTITRDLIHSGRYRSLLEHFKPILDTWWEKYSSLQGKGPLHVLVSLDFSFFKVYLYSLALQAAAERKHISGSLYFKFEDCHFVQEIVANANDLLRNVIDFGNTGQLRYAPVRVYVRIISACIFLLKALALGAPADQLDASLGRIDQCAEVLRLYIVDDVHLAGIFASLLETYTREFRERCVPMPSLPHPAVVGTTVNLDQESTLRTSSSYSELQKSLEIENRGVANGGVLDDRDGGSIFEWLAPPFDASMAPFGLDLTQPYGIFDSDLDFIWS